MTESKSTLCVQELELGNTEVVKEVPAEGNIEKKSRTREVDQNINFVLTPELDSQVMKGEDQSGDPKGIKKPYSSVMESYLVRESNNTILCRLKIENQSSNNTAFSKTAIIKVPSIYS